MKCLNINLDERSYDIIISRDILSKVGEFISSRLEPSRSIIITHPSVKKIFGKQVESGLTNNGHYPVVIEIPEGETSKSLQQVELVYDRMLEMKCDRKSVLIALGGGVVGDLTGFIAATYQRGIPFIQIPTTLLSQVDSADPELFAFLENNSEKIISLNPGCIEHIIETSCAIKAQVVEKDERESRHRMILNFGHTFGHSIEALTNYTKYLHGEALSIGMVQAALLSAETGLCSKDVPIRITNLLKKFGLPVQAPDLGSKNIIESMYHDKKSSHNKLRFILAKAIGSVEIVDDVSEIPIETVLNK